MAFCPLFDPFFENNILAGSIAVYQLNTPIEIAVGYLADHAHKRRDPAAAGDKNQFTFSLCCQVFLPYNGCQKYALTGSDVIVFGA